MVPETAGGRHRAPHERYLAAGSCVFIAEMAKGTGVSVEEPPAVRVETAERGIDELYARHIGAGVRLSYLLTGDRSQAEDLAQEAFVRCWGDSGTCASPTRSRRTCGGRS